METLRFSTLVLAAGKGTRMKSPLPKVLHQACGSSLLAHVLEAAAGAGHHYVVVGHGREEVIAELTRLKAPYREVWQKEQRGTGHAAQEALPAFTEQDDVILIMNGDGPLLKPETIKALLVAHRSKRADLTLGVMELDSPFGYGRVVAAKNGALKKIVEEKEASEKEKKIRLVNGGLYAVNRRYLKEFLPKLKPSGKTGEFYLTDIVGLGAAKKKKLFAFEVPAEELLGVNDMSQLAEAEEVIRRRIRDRWMQEGVRLESPNTVWMDSSVKCESGARIGPNVVLKGSTRISSQAVIEAGCVVKDSVIEEGAELLAYSHLDGALVRAGAHIGPFARLRPGAEIGPGAKIGNFVEVKKSKIGKGAKVNHLSYVGDAEVGEGANLGCGFIACNYDGFNKHKTIVGDRAFVGSGVQAVAPIEIGKDSYVASGSTINRNVPEGSLAVARAKQENKEGYAERLKSRMQAMKKNKGE